jgi:HPt (histidine-containing phosphotransfer) domain-containing protein
VDVADGLGRLLGNRKAYFSLLRKFVDRGRGSAATIRSALAASDIESAIREAHSVKGVAAGLGIKGIAAQAAGLEAAIRRKDGPQALEPAIAEYERLLATVLAAIAAGLALA